MADYLDDTGLHIDSLEARNIAVKSLWRALIAPNLDLSTDQPSGQVVEISNERVQSALELLREVYSAWDPDSATGHSLTALALLTGTQRRAATHGRVTLTVTLTGGTTLPAGNIAAVTGDATNRWVTDVAVVAPAGPPADYPVAATAEQTGAIQAIGGTITVIASPFGGWTAVTNAADAIEGLAEETDTALRLRREIEVARAGSATINAIRADLIALTGMISVGVTENDSDVAALGVPPHSFEAIIWDGPAPHAVADIDIAEVIFETKSAGIRASGVTPITHTDEQGNDHVIRFTRAVATRVSVEVTIPAADRGPGYVGDPAVADAIEAWADDFFAVGADVYRSEISAAVVVLPGVLNVSLVRLVLGPSPPGVPAAVDLVMTVAQIATIAAADVTVL